MKTSYKELLNEKDYLKVLIASFITRIGDGIDMIAFSWLVYEISGSTALVAAIYGVNMIPNLTIGFVSGVVCKYVSEKNIMWICDFGRGFCVMLIAILYLNQSLEIWHLFVIMFLNSTFESFRTPAQMSVFPKILPEAKRENGLAIEQSLVGGASLVGLCVGPVCIGLFGLGGAMVIDSLSFILCGSIILLLKNVRKTETDDSLSLKSGFIDLKEGLVYAKKDSLLMSICFFACIVNFIFVPVMAFQAPYVKDYLSMGSEGIAIIGIGTVLGMVLINPLIPMIKKFISYKRQLILAGICVGISYIGFGLLPEVYPILKLVGLSILSFSVGGFLAIVNFPIRLATYGRVDQVYLARFSALMGALSLGAQPLGAFIFGALAVSIDIPIIYIACGVIVALLFASLSFNKTLRQLNNY